MRAPAPARAAPAPSLGTRPLRTHAHARAPLAFDAHLGERIGGKYVDPDIPPARAGPLASGGRDLGQASGLCR